MRFSKVKKAMNVKCAMNKLCGGSGDAAKRIGFQIKAFSECQRAAFLIQLDNDSDCELFNMLKEILHSLS